MNDAVETAVPAKAVAAWRTLSLSELFFEGCLTFVNNNNELCGYIISRPIEHRQIPPLDSLLKKTAPDADQFFIHDIAILPKHQGQGLAEDGLSQILTVAGRSTAVGLVSVYNTGTFWGRFEFKKPEETDKPMPQKLEQYGNNATYLERENKSN
ncbi:hypothetical protein GQ44DRAFT_724793 [Phaeosphaeriaceae sp. PMI808]|nr:hypothetical protein GQ44DRAFT_724793 [Phaeosphaeriaceae sp. PMI808]